MIGYIYKITNTINGKIYIGQTVRSVTQRFKEHFHPSSGSRYLARSIKKYGKESFILTILETVQYDDKHQLIDKLNELEIKYINENNSLCPNGYNGLAGGTNTIGRAWSGKMSPQSVLIRAQKHKKSIICNETKQIWPSIKECAESFNTKPECIHRVLRGIRKHFRNLSFSYFNSNSIKFSKEAKTKISKATKNRSKMVYKKLTEEQINRMKTPIICNETGIKYDSLTQAAKQLNLSISKISLVLKGKRKHHKGFTFSLFCKQSLVGYHKEV